MREGVAVAPPAAGPARWGIRGRTLRVDRPLVMGVLNVTPDSFSDGGRHLDPRAAVRRAHEMVEEGADLLDLGGESTRPGARAVPAREEWARIGPVLRALEDAPVPISVDTSKPRVAERALGAGAAVLNDVTGLGHGTELARLAAEAGAGLVLMHMRGDPRTMQEDTRYEDLPGEVALFLREAIGRALGAGCEAEQLVVDPGIGFGKSAGGCLRLLVDLEPVLALGRPLMVGPSRKSFLGETLGVPVGERLEGTLAACVVALLHGARLFRVHDVRPVRRALDLAWAALEARGREG